MDANQFLAALRKRWPVVVVFSLLGLVAGLAYALAQPVLYQATSSVYVASRGGDTTQEQLQGSTFAQNLVESYVQLATEPVVLEPVVQRLGLKEDAEQLAKSVRADLQVSTVIIRVTVTDQNPARAAAIANATTESLSEAARTLSSTGKAPAIVMHPVAEAKAPTHPSSPNWPFLLISGLGIGLLLGLAWVLLRQLLNTRIDSDEELRSTPGLGSVPYLGSLAHRRGRERVANLMLAAPHGVSAEQYRRVITNLEFAGIDRRIRSVTVTSALPGDGKSTTALNLAFAAAERAQRVLLVDVDLRRPTVAEYLGIDGAVGLTDVLLGTASPADAIQRVGQVDVIPSGTLPPNVTQLVTSEAMARVFADLLMRYDFVVVDAPPLLPVIDALTLSKLTDGAVLVARQHTTRRKQFALALESLLQVQARVIGVVLNDVPKADSGYGHYGYGSAGSAAAHAAPAVGDASAERFLDDDGARRDARQSAPTYAD
jgi:capsular exopolysaccharide synthesis family protein